MAKYEFNFGDQDPDNTEYVTEELVQDTLKRIRENDLATHTRAVTQFLVVPFTPTGRLYLNEALTRATIPMGPEGKAIRQFASFSDWILNNPTNPNIEKAAVLAEREIFGKLSPFTRGLAVTGEATHLPDPLQWMKELTERGAFVKDDR